MVYHSFMIIKVNSEHVSERMNECSDEYWMGCSKKVYERIMPYGDSFIGNFLKDFCKIFFIGLFCLKDLIFH